MGWLIELFVEAVGLVVADEAAKRMPAWGCGLILLGIAGLVVAAIWLT
jgi:hypothetical protein